MSVSSTTLTNTLTELAREQRPPHPGRRAAIHLGEDRVGRRAEVMAFADPRADGLRLLGGQQGRDIFGRVKGVQRGGPRQVGTVMRLHGDRVAWWRVVRADGRPADCLVRRDGLAPQRPHGSRDQTERAAPSVER